MELKEDQTGFAVALLEVQQSYLIAYRNASNEEEYFFDLRFCNEPVALPPKLYLNIEVW